MNFVVFFFYGLSGRILYMFFSLLRPHNAKLNGDWVLFAHFLDFKANIIFLFKLHFIFLFSLNLKIKTMLLYFSWLKVKNIF